MLKVPIKSVFISSHSPTSKCQQFYCLLIMSFLWPVILPPYFWIQWKCEANCFSKLKFSNVKENSEGVAIQKAVVFIMNDQLQNILRREGNLNHQILNLDHQTKKRVTFSGQTLLLIHKKAISLSLQNSSYSLRSKYVLGL